MALKTAHPKAVVAGGAGFLGSHLCQRLIADGFEVLCVDDLSTGRESNIRHLLEHAGFSFLRSDVAMERLTVQGDVELVFHLASPASPTAYLARPVETLLAGSLGTRNLLELARSKHARFLLASTSEVYGDPQVSPQSEEYWGHVNPVGPRSAYDEAKRFAESLTVAYRSASGVDTGIARIFNTYGPRMQADDGRVVSTFIRQALSEMPLTVHGDGHQTRSLCYVDDTVEGLMRFARSEHSGPVNLGSPRELTVRRIAELVRVVTKSSSPIQFVAAMVDDPKVRCPDISLAKTLLKWVPAVSLETGLENTAKWMAGELNDALPARV
ncbi:UDP-glucuronic acid decarboxylase family protein [Streptomyces erythrochromogenes]|uniref:UDP-glucuronic acid decarboxylase family protein n=1 Tax=Streptomyces erythrochromogenes TaxID=285574 RepID=UPI0004CDC0E5|nr:UDP-glucuronic acid decarboxylase family protein [Streptomyces erythrochromogenes]MCX5583163.1 SDR family oxidoreductase [Streptomyces erythrochromogenes]